MRNVSYLLTIFIDTIRLKRCGTAWTFITGEGETNEGSQLLPVFHDQYVFFFFRKTSDLVLDCHPVNCRQYSNAHSTFWM